MQMAYNPEVFFTRVGQEIEKRGTGNFVAGDDNPYYRHKRLKFLTRFLDSIDFQSKTVLEVGFGPGGNLWHIAMHHKPKVLFGADISQKMCDLAAKNLRGLDNIKLAKIDGTHLPFEDQSIETSFTVTVLQHVTDGKMLLALIKDICRVTKDTIVIMEDIGSHQELSGEGSTVNRTVDIYKRAFGEDGFELQDVQYLNTKVSRRWYEFSWRVYRRLFGRKHHEGEQINTVGKLLIGIPMMGARFLDELFVERSNLAKLTFTNTSRHKPMRPS
jgi:SAM-dependent methyltransferase